MNSSTDEIEDSHIIDVLSRENTNPLVPFTTNAPPFLIISVVKIPPVTFARKILIDSPSSEIGPASIVHKSALSCLRPTLRMLCFVSKLISSNTYPTRRSVPPIAAIAVDRSI